MIDIKFLEDKALWVRRKVLEMAVKSNSGHVSTAMSQTELLVALYYGVLKHDPINPKWEERDIFILSKGQGGIGLYPILADRGYFPLSFLDNFVGRGSKLGVHAESHIPGVEILSGSLGHGLPIATGMCQAFKNDGKDNLVICLTGDGELQEGSNWEAMMWASHHKLSNLILIIDRNGQNTLGRTDGRSNRDGPGLNSLWNKLDSFGFAVQEINGHSFQDILCAFGNVKNFNPWKDSPKAIIANTKKGKGLSVMEDQRSWHYKVPSGSDLDKCWEDLKVPVEERPVPNISQVKHGKGMRDRFFDALFEHFKQDRNMVLVSADNGAPSMEQFIDLPGQFFQVGIAEQEMVGLASGLALQGKKVYCYAIAPFVTTRVHEFLKLDVCAMNLPICMVGVGAGYAYDIMSTTHHCVEDIAIMRALPNMTVYSPSDGETARWIADATVENSSPCYVRLDRGGVPDLYVEGSVDWKDGLAEIESHDVDEFLPEIHIVATGIMVHQALKVAEELTDYVVKVIDVFKLNPLPERRLFNSLCGADFVVTLEEHQLNGGLSSIFAEFQTDWLCEYARKHLRIAVPNKFSFSLGGREALWEENGLDVDSIVRRIREWASSFVLEARDMSELS